MITVKDIREKEFSAHKRGYHEDEVDEFLDEVADQMEALLRENRTLMKKLEETEAALAAAENGMGQPSEMAQPVSAPIQETRTDDSAYFRNLETTLRETLLSAQRVADQTISDAKQKAEKTLAEATAQAEALKREAASESATLRTTLAQESQVARVELEQLKADISTHRKKFRDMLTAQISMLDADDSAKEN